MRCLLKGGLLLLAAGNAYAYDYSARFMAGSYVSSELFNDKSDGSQKNDFATISSRFFLRLSNYGEGKYEVIADLRDKHDFFDLLNQQALALTPGNDYQVRQVSLRNPAKTGALYWTVGRFPVPEAGAVFTDGADVGIKWSPAFRTSIFGGLNPKRWDQTYVQFNSNSTVFGTYSLYQPASNWKHSFYWANAVVGQTIVGTLTRLYWFNNLFYQWDGQNQIVALLYLDFVPNPDVQTGVLSWRQEIAKPVINTFNLTAIDVIEYSYRQSLLTLLSPSPYKEASDSLRFRTGRRSNFDLHAAYGVRSYDGLSKLDVSAGPSFSEFLDRHFSLQSLVGYRQNFTMLDSYARLNVGYFSNIWEFSADGEFGVRTQTTGNIYHPFIGELTAARYFSRSLYATVSVQQAQMENVHIFSAFMKFGYRFGSKDIAPLRDGAPQRGPL